MKRFIPYPSDARVGTSGLAPVRVLMEEGRWLVPEDQRPKLAEEPVELTKEAKKAAYEFRAFRMDTSSSKKLRRKEPTRVIPVVAYEP